MSKSTSLNPYCAWQLMTWKVSMRYVGAGSFVACVIYVFRLWSCLATPPHLHTLTIIVVYSTLQWVSGNVLKSFFFCRVYDWPTRAGVPGPKWEGQSPETHSQQNSWWDQWQSTLPTDYQVSASRDAHGYRYSAKNSHTSQLARACPVSLIVSLSLLLVNLWSHS